MSSFMLSKLTQWWNDLFARWLNQRIAPTQKITLDRHKIFIFPTREGFLFLFVIIAMFMGGVNYANSLVLGLSFFLIGLFIITILHTYRNLSGVVVEASHVESCFAGESASFTVNVSRRGARVHESIALAWEHGAYGLCDLVEDQEANVLMLLPTQKRGWYKPGRLRIQTVFPLGIIRAWSLLDLNVKCLVYPQAVENVLYKPYRNAVESGKNARELGPDDFEGLRPYRPGDPLKHVHWKAVARMGEMHTKTFVTTVQKTQWLAWSDFSISDVEFRLSCLCFWVLRLSEKGVPYGLRMPHEVVSPNTGLAHKQRCLNVLAMYGNANHADPPVISTALGM